MNARNNSLWKIIPLAATLAVFSGCPNPVPADTTQPSGTIVINNDDAYTVTASVTLVLTASDAGGTNGLRMLISNAGDFSGASWENFSATRAWILASGDGSKTVFARFRDAAGNDSPVASDAILLDATLPGSPGAPDLAAADDTGSSNSDNITRQTAGLTFSGGGTDGGATVRLYDGAQGLLGSGPADLAGNWSIDLDLAEGAYTLFARALDNAGNESPSSALLTVIVDTTPPAIPGLLKPVTGENTGMNKRPVFTWTTAAGADNYELQADDSYSFSHLNYDWTNLSGTSFIPASDMSASAVAPVGTRYYVRIRALDAAGNEGAWSNAGTLTRYVNVGRCDQDFNGDGYSDAIVGASNYNNEQGRAYIYYGGSSVNDTADVTLTGEAAANAFGYSVSSAGDVNGDGYADAVVGAYGYSDYRGCVYIYYGGFSMNNTADVALLGEASTTRFGRSVASAGDVNGDGYSDVIIGANGYNNYQGRAYIFYGGSFMDKYVDITMIGEETTNYFGCSVSCAGDMNGDGYADVIVGAYGYNSSRGRAYIYYGGSSMDNSGDVTMTGGNTNHQFGGSVASAGDVNSDGYADVIVGAVGFNYSQGLASIYYGGVSVDNIADVTMTGEATYNYFGGSVASAGDVNGDGCADVIVGAFNYSNGQGRAYIYYGGASLDNTADVTMTGEAAGNWFGDSVASPGDVNGDGYADVIVGAYNYSNSQGRAYIYYGSASLNNTADVTMTGEAAGNMFGCSVD